MDIEDVEEILDIKFPEGDWDTLAGFVISRLGFLPTKEDKNLKVDFENITFTVLELDERRIEKIKAEIND